MWHCVAILLSLAASVAAQGGDPNCPCIEWANLDKYMVGTLDDGHLVYAPSGKNGPQYKYPVNYGNAVCKTHDKGQPPMCNTPSGPPWCDQKWCYIDTNKCTDVAITRTQFFPEEENLYFSYQTCTGAQGANSFSKSMATSPDTIMADLIKTMSNNLGSVKQQIEASFETVSQMLEPEKCEVPGMCPCETCQPHAPWKGEKVDFTEVSASFPKKIGQMDLSKSSCLAKAIGDPYRKVAAMESDARGSRVGYQYYADQLTGSYVQWPAIQWCPRGAQGEEKAWDPRLRPWYAAAATGPKDVVIVVDVSGSMKTNDRHIAARKAVEKALLTLSWQDFASIVLFDNGVAGVYSDVMVPVTEEERSRMTSWANSKIYPQGGTSFTAGLWKALKVIESSVAQSRSAWCEKAILFLTDGLDNQWKESDYSHVSAECTRRGTIMFTYALGSGADTTITKRLACENRGVFYHVNDGDDLASVMANYYKYFAAGSEVCKPSWVKYRDPISGDNLYAGCSNIKDRTSVNPELLGATCMDANMVAKASALQANPKWEEFVCSISDMTKKCQPNYLQECHRERIRKAYSDKSVCGFDTNAVPDQCGCVDTNCQDDEDFVCALGYYCDTWVGDACTMEVAKQWGYNQAQLDEVITHCPRSCGLCKILPAEQCSKGSTGCKTSQQSGPVCRPCVERALVSGTNIEGRQHCCSADGQPCPKIQWRDDPGTDGSQGNSLHVVLIIVAGLATMCQL